ncbi:flagellar motor protein MotB [Longirhabdus pacifica]|uniref:flagellar motor protein MotB n=1 Tax=Longirhabdus pacifica TaxID=2305227 RepID=UPI0010088761|nr:flagellar motor protein MotB [Longirhabdus pacifica]
MRRRARSRDSQPTESRDRWLITYADLITLLLIFFVFLYAISQIDSQKYAEISQALQSQFNDGSNQLLEDGSGLIDGLSRQEKQMEEVKQQLEAYITENDLQASITVTDEPIGIRITLKDKFLFDLGRADLKKEAVPILGTLAELFPTLDGNISIEGHTDNLAVSTGSVYQDNWGLSAARSLSVLRYFTDTAYLDPNRFVVTGYADTRPVDSNDTEEGRQKNRRVEIVILRSVEQVNQP